MRHEPFKILLLNQPLITHLGGFQCSPADRFQHGLTADTTATWVTVVCDSGKFQTQPRRSIQTMESIYADFHNLDPFGRVRLNTVGSIQDLKRQGIVLHDGLKVRLYCEEFELVGIVEFSSTEHIWTARFNWEDRRSPE
jgi:hypothetical protein